MKKISLIIGIVILVIVSCSKISSKGESKIKLKNTDDSLSYIYGMMLGYMTSNIDIDFNANALKAGMDDFKNKKGQIPDEMLNGYSQMLFGKVFKRTADNNLKVSEKYFEKNAKEEGIITTESGLQYKIIKEGTGETPAIDDNVTFHYKGMLSDGRVFDSSVERGQPLVSAPGNLIKGWTEALIKMPVGSKWMLYIPPALGYGERVGKGSIIEPNEPMIFEVEILDIVKAQPSDSLSVVK